MNREGCVFNYSLVFAFRDTLTTTLWLCFIPLVCDTRSRPCILVVSADLLYVST